jgi:membrane-associated phospholipid phosphatase
MNPGRTLAPTAINFEQEQNVIPEGRPGKSTSMKPPHSPFVAWPGRKLLGQDIALAAILAVWWTVVYVGSDAVASRHDLRVRIHLDFEERIPFVPAFLIIYRSIDEMLLLAPLVLRTRTEIRSLALTLGAVITLAGVGFLLLPAEATYSPQDAGAWEQMVSCNRRLTLRTNMVPSLHVATSVVVLSAFGRRCRKVGKSLLVGWGCAIAISTLLIHEHHLLDVFTGLLLGVGGNRLVYRRWLLREEPVEVWPASVPERGGT